jgi:hypothetical protein
MLLKHPLRQEAGDRKHFLSRKNLSLIQLVPAEVLTGVHMLHAFHQCIETSRATCVGCQLRQPFAEGRVQGLVLRARN